MPLHLLRRETTWLLQRRFPRMENWTASGKNTMTQSILEKKALVNNDFVVTFWLSRKWWIFFSHFRWAVSGGCSCDDSVTAHCFGFSWLHIKPSKKNHTQSVYHHSHAAVLNKSASPALIRVCESTLEQFQEERMHHGIFSGVSHGFFRWMSVQCLYGLNCAHARLSLQWMCWSSSVLFCSQYLTITGAETLINKTVHEPTVLYNM